MDHIVPIQLASQHQIVEFTVISTRLTILRTLETSSFRCNTQTFLAFSLNP